MNLKLKDASEAPHLIARIQGLCNEINSLEKDRVSESTQVQYILSAIPTTVSMLEVRADIKANKHNLEAVRRRVIDRCKDIKKANDMQEPTPTNDITNTISSAGSNDSSNEHPPSAGRGRGRGHGERGRGRGKGKCLYCNRAGHFMRKCQELSNIINNNRAQNQNVANSMAPPNNNGGSNNTHVNDVCKNAINDSSSEYLKNSSTHNSHTFKGMVEDKVEVEVGKDGTTAGRRKLGIGICGTVSPTTLPSHTIALLETCTSSQLITDFGLFKNFEASSKSFITAS
jgi:hypothetical protein